MQDFAKPIGVDACIVARFNVCVVTRKDPTPLKLSSLSPDFSQTFFGSFQFFLCFSLYRGESLQDSRTDANRDPVALFEFPFPGIFSVRSYSLSTSCNSYLNSMATRPWFPAESYPRGILPAECFASLNYWKCCFICKLLVASGVKHCVELTSRSVFLFFDQLSFTFDETSWILGRFVKVAA